MTRRLTSPVRLHPATHVAGFSDRYLTVRPRRPGDAELLAFTRRLIAFRHAHPAFRRRRWFLGRAIHGADCKDIAWFTLEG